MPLGRISAKKVTFGQKAWNGGLNIYAGSRRMPAIGFYKKRWPMRSNGLLSAFQEIWFLAFNIDLNDIDTWFVGPNPIKRNELDLRGHAC
jgi:hypothetical protein